MDAEELKILLGLTNGFFGGFDKEWTASKDSVDEIDSWLQSLMGLTQSSAELNKELDLILILVRCSYHDHGYSKRCRIEEWKEVLTIGNGNIDPFAVFGGNIRQSFGNTSG